MACFGMHHRVPSRRWTFVALAAQRSFRGEGRRSILRECEVVDTMDRSITPENGIRYETCIVALVVMCTQSVSAEMEALLG